MSIRHQQMEDRLRSLFGCTAEVSSRETKHSGPRSWLLLFWTEAFRLWHPTTGSLSTRSFPPPTMIVGAPCNSQGILPHPGVWTNPG
jgi:hypothetical protein